MTVRKCTMTVQECITQSGAEMLMTQRFRRATGVVFFPLSEGESLLVHWAKSKYAFIFKFIIVLAPFIVRESFSFVLFDIYFILSSFG